MSTNTFTAQQRQMIEDMSQWDSLPQNIRDLLAEQIENNTWDTLPIGTPVLVTTNYGGKTVEFIGYTSQPDSDGDVKMARRIENSRVSERWVTVADITSITVLTPANETSHITVSDGFYILHNPAQAAPLGSGGANRAYSIPEKMMIDLGTLTADRDDFYPLVWRNRGAYGPEQAQAAYDKAQPSTFLPAAKRTTQNGVEYLLLDTDNLIDSYAAQHGHGVIGLDRDGDSKNLTPSSTAYRPWVARADGKDMDDNEIDATGYNLVRDLRTQ